MSPQVSKEAMSEASKQKSVINRTEVKRRLLQFAKDTRSHCFTRVSEETLTNIEATVEARIRNHVTALPSKGKTI